MARHTHSLAWLAMLLAVTSSIKDQSRWSRQISSYTADISDWVPLAGPTVKEPPAPKINTPIKRQAVAEPRILTEPFPGFSRPTGFGQEAFPSRAYFNSPANRQLYLQSVPSAPQNFLTDQGFGQSIRFGLGQSNYPLNQGFAGPQFPIKFEPYPKQSLPAIPQNKPFINQAPKLKPDEVKFIDDNAARKKAQSLQKIKFDTFEKLPKTEPLVPKPKTQKEEVQLLYVPLESLNKGQFNFRGPVAAPQLINSDLYSQGLPKVDPLKQPFTSEYQRPLTKPIDSFGLNQDYFASFDSVKEYDQVPKFSTLSSPFPTAPPTTPKPKKLKAHQPPLAIFQEVKKNSQIKVGTVLATLKNADTIAVLDTVNPINAPKVFIGPSSLTPPEGFAKFELPYLSNIENSDKKLRQLPFFVAPLSYNTPQGFAKIPFPSPHVGSVVINSLIKDTPSIHQTQQIYSTPPVQSTPLPNIAFNEQYYKPEPKPVTQKPMFNYYSTVSPKTNAPLNQHSNYYSFEPQTVTTLSSPKPAPVRPTSHKGNYFLSNANGDEYNPAQYVNFPPQQNYKNKETVAPHSVYKPETTTTFRTTTTTTTPKPSTYPSQLLETHNPYSINQAFHFSTPLDYHSYFDEFKETYAPPGVNLEVPKSSTVPVSSSPAPTKQQEIITERPKQQTSPNYVQNYSPEIQYESEIPGSRYPSYNTNDYVSKTETNFFPQQPAKVAENNQPISNQTPEPQYNTESQSGDNLTETIINRITGPPADVDNTKQYEQFETSKYASNEQSSPTTTTSTTTTTTRRSPIRSRGRPRYTTAKPDGETTTRAIYTRKPLRERRPLPPRSRYEPNKITTEKTTKKYVDSNESTTKSSRSRIRGRVQFKPTENDEHYDKKSKGHSSKEADLAYQRDILHQNYPVTLMERTSTVDIEAITEPSPRISSTKTLGTAIDNYDTENAYAHESAAISHLGESDIKDEIPSYTSRSETIYEDPENYKYSTNNEEGYPSRSSVAVSQSSATHEESMEKQEDFPRHTTPVQRYEKPEVSSYNTDSLNINTEQPAYSVSIQQNSNQEDVTTNQETEISKTDVQDATAEEQPEENVVQTTPSYNRVRVRPGVIRQYHQASSTESSRTKTDRRRPVQAITYRPAFDKRRTTMRIDEIEADLKTKQVHSRPEVQDYRHPVYKPDPSTEGSTASTPLETTKRGQFRRRRPTYTTTSTESVSTKKIYEVKNRFRGRRPTTEKTDVQTESTSTTVRNTPNNRYSHRPRLSERYNKKPEPEHEESEDQDSNYSINRPKFVAPDSDAQQWSPKISSESFKPFNPNEIMDESKIATTERRTDIDDDGELDIITARNDYEDILISVTPATNNRAVKKIPDIPPTLEALVEQSKTTSSDTTDNMSTFETMLEEVMKSLEEQDKDEYTSNVMKHKGGEIGEIPPEKIITSDDEYAKLTTALDQEVTTVEPAIEDSANEERQKAPKSGRRGFWKKVKVRPVNTESIEVAESQYYTNTVNRLGEPVKKNIYDKSDKQDKPRISVTTYKPNHQFIQNAYEPDDVTSLDDDTIVDIDIAKINNTQKRNTDIPEEEEEPNKTTPVVEKEITTEKPTSVGEEDLGTGSPDPTLIDNMYYSTPTEPTASEGMFGILNKADNFSLMDYLFGSTSSENINQTESKTETLNNEFKRTTVADNIEIATDQPKSKIVTTETSYIPAEITSIPSEENTESIIEFDDIKKVALSKQMVTEPPVTVAATSESSFMNPSNVISTSMSTEISHETEICFRGKCIKTRKDKDLL